MFPVVTNEIQKEYEASITENSKDYIPELCGFHGRACRQMDKEEGANRVLCSDCALAEYAKRTS